MITLNFNNETLDVQASDDSYRYRSLMGKPQLTLKFSLAEYINIPTGAWCMFQNEKFVMRTAANIKKNGTRNIEYTLTLGQDDDILRLYKMRNSVDGRLKYSMCAKPRELVEEIVKNLNNRTGSSVWSVGTCIEASEKTIEFNHTYIDEALQSVADLFETEWEIVNHQISLHKVEYFKDDPLPLSYGKGNGFVPGVGRSTQSNEMPIKRLYVQGGNRNIDRSKYGTMFGYSNSPAELRLPRNQKLEYEGRTYQTDNNGYYIERVDKISDAVKDDSLDCSDIYPSRIGTVSKVETIDKENNFYDIIDNSIPSNLNFNDYIIGGETPTIVFQSGMLAGEDKEFEFKYNHAERRFELVPQEIDGVTMPNETYKPDDGDTYAIFGIMLPKEYICNDTDKSGASWDMFREGARKLYENEDPKFTFSGELQGLYAKRNWLNIGGRLKVGSYILFTDEQFAKDGISIRITGIKDYINSPYSPSLEISNSVSGKALSSQLQEIGNQEVIIDDTKKSILQFTKRRFRDALETIEMLNDSLLDFSGAVNPITVQTMAALIGDESLQFRFVASKSNLTQVGYNITYDNSAKQLHCPHGFLQHMTLGISDISSSHENSEYKVWEMSEYLSPVLTEADSKYYLYAKVNRTDTSAKGSFVLSETAIAMDDVEGYYHLLVGVLNSESNGERSYVDLYGFTEILPGRITTDRIVSGNGNSYFDMLNNAMKLGDALDFNSRGDGKMRIKGTLVQSQSGDEDYIGCFRGTYNSTYTYYQGDEVTYTVNNVTSTYRYIYATPSKGIAPTNTNYWKVVAQGVKGDDGIGVSKVEEFYLISNSLTDITTSTSGWTTSVQTPTKSKRYLWNYEKITYTDGKSVPTTPQVIGMYSEDGRGISKVTEYYARSTSNSSAPTSWSTKPPTLTTTYKYLWNYEVVTYTDNTTSKTTPAVIGVYGDKGDKGDDGIDGNYTELRFAKNGSLTSPPSLTKTSLNPSGWSTTTPSVGTAEYLWMTRAVKNGAGTQLISQWTTPVRITPYDGKDGADGSSPVMVYRGVYDSSKTYYGNKYRLDCVKSGSTYYIARIDAGTFSNIAPTDTSKWNSFGASFESVATNLLLAEGANIGDWFIQGGKIVSTLGTGNKITLDAVLAQILIESSKSGGDYSQATTQGAKVTLDANNGLIEARSKSNSSRVSYMSPTGIFSNNAETQAVSLTTGLTRKAAIVGIGYGNVSSNVWDNENVLAGVYGYASNSGNAPEYGGYFQKLMAAGLFLKAELIDDNDSTSTYISETTSLVIGYSSENRNVYLPNDGVIGRIIIFKQWWTGTMTIYARSGQKIYDDNTSNNYHKVYCGKMAIAIFTVGYINGVKTSAWLINRIDDLIAD